MEHISAPPQGAFLEETHERHAEQAHWGYAQFVQANTALAEELVNGIRCHEVPGTTTQERRTETADGHTVIVRSTWDQQRREFTVLSPGEGIFQSDALQRFEYNGGQIGYKLANPPDPLDSHFRLGKHRAINEQLHGWVDQHRKNRGLF